MKKTKDLLAKFFGVVSSREMEGIRIDLARPFWEVSGKTDFPSLLEALEDLLPQESILYFEGSSPSKEVAQFLREHSVPERAHVAYGTIWPRPSLFHVPATITTLGGLARLMRSREYSELAIHFHAYRDQTVLLEWHDAFTQPMLLSGEFPEQQIRAFAVRLRMSYAKGGTQ